MIEVTFFKRFYISFISLRLVILLTDLQSSESVDNYYLYKTKRN